MKGTGERVDWVEGCGGWMVEGRSLSARYISTQWTLATGGGDGEGRNNVHYDGNVEPVVTQRLVGLV